MAHLEQMLEGRLAAFQSALEEKKKENEDPFHTVLRQEMVAFDREEQTIADVNYVGRLVGAAMVDSPLEQKLENIKQELEEEQHNFSDLHDQIWELILRRDGSPALY